MDTLIFELALVQVGLPVVLIFANALIPAASATGFALRGIAVLLALIYLALTGLWLFPPWWTPYALMVLHLLLSGWVVRRRLEAGQGWRRAERVVGLVTTLAVMVLIVPVLKGRTAPDVAIDLAMPLEPGRYLVSNGGASPRLNAHFYTLNRESAAAFRGQSYALDIIGIDRLGLRARGILPADPTAYLIHGRDVRAPCTGTVIGVIDGVADNAVPQMNREAMTGNSVILSCEGLAVVLAHFRPGSLDVVPGNPVTVGQKLAQVGNSGNSGEPHLHLHVQTISDAETPIAGTPLWFTIEGDFPVRNARIHVSE